jgi:phosphatidylserine/phosphatidylglycerophosphate/cardiolipin synthase-like enzyme
MNASIRVKGWLGVLSAAVLAAAPASAQRKSASVYFSPKGGGHEAVASLVRSATKTIDVAMYSVSPGQVAMWGPLTDAVQRGVKCRFVLHDAQKTAAAKAQALEGIGCDVRTIGPTMHEKFAIIDGVHVATGSANWSTGAEQKYSENITTYTKYMGVVRDYQAEFERLWAASVDVPFKTRPSRYPPILGVGPGTAPAPSGDGIQNLFTTLNSSSSALLNDAIVALINGAKSKIDVAVANFDTEAIATALCQASARGVAVRVLTDQGQYGVTASKITKVEACKPRIPVRYKVYGLAWFHPRSQLMHHKYLIVDGTTLATGSYNWSVTAEKANAENLQVIVQKGTTNSTLLKAFQKEFDTLWDLNRAKIPALMAAFTKPLGRCQPIHWDTDYLRLVITLTREEYRAVRALALKAGLWDRKKWIFKDSAGRQTAASCVDVEKMTFLPSMPGGTFAAGL